MSTHESLPQPVGELPSQAGDAYNEADRSKTTETNPVSSAGFAAISAVGVNDAKAQVASVQNGLSQTVSSTIVTSDDTDLSAEDLDLIEKTWVRKAKELVRRTAGDPSEQNRQLSMIKAEYIKKRYNKDVKVRT